MDDRYSVDEFFADSKHSAARRTFRLKMLLVWFRPVSQQDATQILVSGGSRRSQATVVQLLPATIFVTVSAALVVASTQREMSPVARLCSSAARAIS